jgi:hypothetical protein
MTDVDDAYPALRRIESETSQIVLRGQAFCQDIFEALSISRFLHDEGAGFAAKARKTAKRTGVSSEPSFFLSITTPKKGTRRTLSRSPPGLLAV